MSYRVVVAAALVSWPALAAPQCTVGPLATGFPAESAATAATAPTFSAPTVDASARSAALLPSLPPVLDGLPFLKIVAAAGATILDFGVVHSIRVVGARSGTEFRIFSVLPGGQAAIEGAPLAMTVDQLTQLAGSDLTSLGRLAGVDGLFVRSAARFQVFYALPDGQAVVPGILRDINGRNLTRDQVSGVPGAIPTVELQDGSGGGSANQTRPEAALAAVRKASFGSDGPVGAPEIFMMIDPQCIYSIRAYQQLYPYAAAGRIRLSLVPVSILDHEDGGRSTKSALALLAKPLAELPAAWQSGDTNGQPTPEAQARLSTNMTIATAVGLQGTPTLFWRDRSGKASRIDGMPTDLSALLTSVGD